MQRRNLERGLAPVVLFVYNRLDHLRQTLEALLKNPEAPESIVYVFSDGPRGEHDAAQVNAVRSFIRSVAGFKEIHVIERPRNLGLADNIIDGVSTVLKQSDSVIVLEDDIETSPGFLRYMNDALDLYRNESRVMHVSGYMFPVKGRLPSTFF